jgi:oligopeptide/dipeptide ABC transporter ATP-binding protein
VPLVRDASFELARGELVALVGESGSGKSVTARAVMGLIQRQRGIDVSGSVRLHGAELVGQPARRVRSLRGRELAMIFQEPMSSLDPVFTIEDQMREAVRRRERLGRKEERDRLVELLTTVGIADPRRCLRQYPHQLSGGMCQRVMIAMALASRPEVLIADEPTTALDLTIQAQILGLLERLRRETGVAILLITHDMGVAAQVADRVAVMYAGRVVETGTPDRMFAAPLHPYTEGLLSCIPAMTGARERLLPALKGSVPDPSNLPTGCAFHPRCAWADDACRDTDPPLAPVDGRPVACWHAADRLHDRSQPTEETS